MQRNCAQFPANTRPHHCLLLLHLRRCVWHQVLTSLDRAFTKLGFTHADMRISNVMEHHLDAEPMYPKGFTSRKQRKAVGVLTEPKVNNFNLPGQ